MGGGEKGDSNERKQIVWSKTHCLYQKTQFQIIIFKVLCVRVFLLLLFKTFFNSLFYNHQFLVKFLNIFQCSTLWWQTQNQTNNSKNCMNDGSKWKFAKWSFHWFVWSLPVAHFHKSRKTEIKWEGGGKGKKKSIILLSAYVKSDLSFSVVFKFANIFLSVWKSWDEMPRNQCLYAIYIFVFENYKSWVRINSFRKDSLRNCSDESKFTSTNLSWPYSGKKKLLSGNLISPRRDRITCFWWQTNWLTVEWHCN